MVLQADADTRGDAFAVDLPDIRANARPPEHCWCHQLEKRFHGGLKSGCRDFRVDRRSFWVKNLDLEADRVRLREFRPDGESHKRDVDIPEHPSSFTEPPQLTAALRGQLQTVGNPSAYHPLEKIQDRVPVGILPISPDTVERGYSYARHAADRAGRSLGPTRGDPDD